MGLFTSPPSPSTDTQTPHTHTHVHTVFTVVYLDWVANWNIFLFPPKRVKGIPIFPEWRRGVCASVRVCSCGITQLQGPLWLGAKSITIQIQVALPPHSQPSYLGYIALSDTNALTHMHAHRYKFKTLFYTGPAKVYYGFFSQQVNTYVLAHGYSHSCICNGLRSVKPTVYIWQRLRKQYIT